MSKPWQVGRYVRVGYAMAGLVSRIGEDVEAGAEGLIVKTVAGGWFWRLPRMNHPRVLGFLPPKHPKNRGSIFSPPRTSPPQRRCTRVA